MIRLEQERHTVIVEIEEDKETVHLKSLRGKNITEELAFRSVEESKTETFNRARTADKIAGIFLGIIAASALGAGYEVISDKDKLLNVNLSLFVATLTIAVASSIAYTMAEAKSKMSHQQHISLIEASVLQTPYHEKVFRN